jgi:hypothetical protein
MPLFLTSDPVNGGNSGYTDLTYVDFDEIPQPPAPSATKKRLYLDKATHLLSSIDAAGVVRTLEVSGAVTSTPSYGSDIRSYMQDQTSLVDRPGDQVIVVPNGLYTAGPIATNRAVTAGTQKGRLVLVAQTPGQVIVDQSPPGTALAGGLVANGDLEFRNSTPRVVFVGFKFQNGTIRTATFPTVAGQLTDLAFWYCEFTFPATVWAGEAGHPVNPGDPSTQYHDAPRCVDMRYGTNHVAFFGCNLHDTGTTVLPRAGCSFLTFVGSKFANLNDGGAALDPNDIVHCDALGFVGGNYHDVTITDCDLNIGAGSGYNTGLLIQDAGGAVTAITMARLWIRNGGTLGGGMNLVSSVAGNGIFGTMNGVHTFNNGFFELAEQVDATTQYTPNWSPTRINFTGSGNTFGTVQAGTDPATAWQAVAGQQYADYLAYMNAIAWAV